MFKLYGYVPNLKLLKASFNEETIIKEIEKYISKVEYIHFMIVLQLNDRMIPYRIILSKREFAEYIEDYKDNRIDKETGITRKREKK